MGGRMRIERCHDAKVVREFLMRPEMYETVAEDGFDEFEPDMEGDCWLCLYLDELIAIYQVRQRNSVMVEIHANVLPEYRKDYSKQTGQMALRWLLDNTRACKVIAEVPVIYPNVRAFAEQFGFEVEGKLAESYSKGGLVDMWILGATREQIEERL
jgi:hypothetical protein